MHLVKKKSPFLLLEIMVALTLVSLCFAPLTGNSIKCFSKEIELLDNMEYERIAEVSFAEIKERLLKNEIPWKELSTSKKEKTVHSLPVYHFSLPGFRAREVERNFKIFCLNEKEGQDGKIYRRLRVVLEIASQKKRNHYEYLLFAQKIST